jgi:hypothetical protein
MHVPIARLARCDFNDGGLPAFYTEGDALHLRYGGDGSVHACVKNFLGISMASPSKGK